MDTLLRAITELINEKVYNEERHKKDTIEHNRLKNLFFDKRKVEAILEKIINSKIHQLDDLHTIDFEWKHNWDILIRDVFIRKCVCEWDKKEDGGECDCKYKDSEREYRPHMYIDLIPSIGEDYGNILRMMKRKIKLTEYDNEIAFEKETGKSVNNYIKIDRLTYSYQGTYILLVDKLETESITRENLKKMYWPDVEVIFIDEINFYDNSDKLK